MHMKRKKGFLWMIMLLVIVIMVAACSSNDSGNENSNNQQNTSETDNMAPADDSEQSEIPNFNVTGFPIVNEKITMKLLSRRGAIHGPFDQMQLFVDMEERTNIRFEFDTPAADSYETRKNLAFAGNDLPDIFLGGPLTANDEIVYGGQGLLLPLGELIDQYAPNLKAILDANPEIRATITTPDGNIYTAPNINSIKRDFVPMMFINQTWLNELGLQMPETIDDLYEVLKGFKSLGSDIIPYTSNKLNDRTAMMSPFGIINTGDFHGIKTTSQFISVVDDQLTFFPTSDAYKEYLMFMHRLFAEGLLDNETFVQTPQQITAKGNNGQVGFFFGSVPFAVVGNELNDDYTLLPPLTSSINNKKMWPHSSNVTRGQFAISHNNPHPEASIRWLDYFYSDEGSVEGVFGKEGMGWEWLDDKKTQWQRTQPEGINPEEFRLGQLTPGLAFIRKAEFSAMRANTGALGVVDDEVEEHIVPYWSSAYPLVYLEEEMQNRINIILADMEPYFEQMEARFITGNFSFDNWDQYVETLNQMGVQEYMDIHQQAYDVWRQN